MSDEVVHFWDLRYEVDQAAQRYAEVTAERDRLRAELHDHLAGAADAVEAMDDEKADVEAERGRLRAVVDAVQQAFVRHDDDHWCIDQDHLVSLAAALDALGREGR